MLFIYIYIYVIYNSEFMLEDYRSQLGKRAWVSTRALRKQGPV